MYILVSIYVPHHFHFPYRCFKVSFETGNCASSYFTALFKGYFVYLIVTQWLVCLKLNQWEEVDFYKCDRSFHMQICQSNVNCVCVCVCVWDNIIMEWPLTTFAIFNWLKASNRILPHFKGVDFPELEHEKRPGVCLWKHQCIFSHLSKCK